MRIGVNTAEYFNYRFYILESFTISKKSSFWISRFGDRHIAPFSSSLFVVFSLYFSLCLIDNDKELIRSRELHLSLSLSVTRHDAIFFSSFYY